MDDVARKADDVVRLGEARGPPTAADLKAT